MKQQATKQLVFMALGVGTMWLPLNYSFYRYSIIGEGAPYALLLAVLAADCVAAVALRDRVARWLDTRPVSVLALSLLTLASNGLTAGLPYLPVNTAASTIVHGLLVVFFAFTFVLLFFAWVQKLTALMFQRSIVLTVGVAGASIVAVFLLVNLFYGTAVYQLAAFGCLAVSGLCWYSCSTEPVEEGSTTMLPSRRTLREWSLLFVAFLAVAVLHAVVFAGQGAVAEQSPFPTWLQHTGLVFMLLLFGGLMVSALRGAAQTHTLFSVFIGIIVAFYLGLLSAMATPGVVGSEGDLAILVVVARTLRIFIFTVLLILCYQDSASAIGTFGLLFFLVEVAADALCYVLAPVLMDFVGLDAAALAGPASRGVAFVLLAVFAGFMLMYFARLSGSVSSEADASPDGNLGDSDNSKHAADAVSAAHPLPLAREERCRALGEAAGLTERETDIFYYLSLGYSVKKIAETLYISTNTVATHSSRLYRKLGVHSRQELIDLVNSGEPTSL